MRLWIPKFDEYLRLVESFVAHHVSAEVYAGEMLRLNADDRVTSRDDALWPLIAQLCADANDYHQDPELREIGDLDGETMRIRAEFAYDVLKGAKAYPNE
jgi:hypothetical protein